MENNWSGKRGKALASMLAVLAGNPDSGIIDYGDTTIMHKNHDAVVLEYLDFYKKSNKGKADDLKYLVFDSKFTNYENLGKLDSKQVKFITIRRRGKKIIQEIDQIPKENWRIVRVGCAVEKTISEKIEFFHFNRISSSMVIKVDFDLTMSILAYNLYRLLALETQKYASLTAETLFVKMVSNSGRVEIKDRRIELTLKKKRSLPVMLEMMNQYKSLTYPWLFDKSIIFKGATTL